MSRKLTTILLFWSAFFSVFASSVLAQVPQGFPWNALVKNDQGEVLSLTDISVEFSLTRNSNVLYQEVHALKTSQSGVAIATIGEGNTVDDFSSIDWSLGDVVLQVRIDKDDDGVYDSETSAQMMSVPYALYAANSQPGPAGPEGPQGIQGEVGPAGPEGPEGPQGEMGPAGSDGQNGLGVSSASITAEGALVFAYTDASVDTVGAVVGPPGPEGSQGETGPVGPAGADGADGSDGIGVASAEINADGELVLNYSNSVADTVGVVQPDVLASAAQSPLIVENDTLKLAPGTSAKQLLYYNASGQWVNLNVSSLAVSNAGGGQPISISQPSLALTYIIALQGMFPSRSISDPLLGTIALVGFNFAPRGWAACDGQLLAISQNSALFALLGTTYGGDGRTTFALPDLRGRVAVGEGTGPGLTNKRLGAKYGVERVGIGLINLPSHSHSISAP